MMRPISSRERKLVAIGLLVALIAAVQLGIVAPILDGFAARAARREELLLRYQHNERTIASIARLRRKAERQGAELGRFTLSAATAELAGELLKERLQRTIESAGGEFRSSDEVTAPTGWIRARADCELTLDQMTRLLRQLQNEPPYLVVESLTVSADKALLSGQPGPMDVRIEAAIPYRPAASR